MNVNNRVTYEDFHVKICEYIKEALIIISTLFI